jgi:hypothetical protein
MQKQISLLTGKTKIKEEELVHIYPTLVTWSQVPSPHNEEPLIKSLRVGVVGAPSLIIYCLIF